MSRQRVHASRPKIKDEDAPTKKRRPLPNLLIEEVLERERLSRQRVNASRTNREELLRNRRRPSVTDTRTNSAQVTDGDVPTRKRGPIVVAKEVLKMSIFPPLDYVT